MTSFYLKSYKLAAIIVVVLALIMAFINIKLASGILLGFIFDYLYNILMSNSLTEILESANRNKFMITLKIIFNQLAIAIPLLLAFIFPGIFNFIGVFIGLVINKICFLFMNIRG